mmetsp:Transcript_35528/g.55491  ORF Transcript_35528/g.55491 Transcript_35528/m.55491 type:complete len:175 (-) Transcript_35528:99-623(-)
MLSGWRAQGAGASAPSTVTVRLRSKKVVKWGEDVVDNEDLGRRKSKKCCVFHKKRNFGESSSESDYSSGAESGSESPRRRHRCGSDRCQSHAHGHKGGSDCEGLFGKSQPSNSAPLEGGRAAYPPADSAELMVEDSLNGFFMNPQGGAAQVEDAMEVQMESSSRSSLAGVHESS